MRHSVICLREEARALSHALTQVQADKGIGEGERDKLWLQMRADLLDVLQALVDMGGADAVCGVFTPAYIASSDSSTKTAAGVVFAAALS